MIKTTNFEISKKLQEIGFKAEAEFFFYLDKPDYGKWHISEEGQILANEKDDCLPSYDLETLLDALPKELKKCGELGSLFRSGFILGYNLQDFDDLSQLLQYQGQGQSLADTAGELIIWLHEENLIKF